MTNEILFPGVEITHENEMWVATYENCAAGGRHTREQAIADLYDLIDSAYKRNQQSKEERNIEPGSERRDAFDSWEDQVRYLSDRVKFLEKENMEWEQSFDLYHSATLRATKLFREINADFPALTLPDTGKMIFYLCKEIERLKSEKAQSTAPEERKVVGYECIKNWKLSCSMKRGEKMMKKNYGHIWISAAEEDTEHFQPIYKDPEPVYEDGCWYWVKIYPTSEWVLSRFKDYRFHLKLRYYPSDLFAIHPEPIKQPTNE